MDVFIHVDAHIIYQESYVKLYEVISRKYKEIWVANTKLQYISQNVLFLFAGD